MRQDRLGEKVWEDIFFYSVSNYFLKRRAEKSDFFLLLYALFYRFEFVNLSNTEHTPIVP